MNEYGLIHCPFRTFYLVQTLLRLLAIIRDYKKSFKFALVNSEEKEERL